MDPKMGLCPPPPKLQLDRKKKLRHYQLLGKIRMDPKFCSLIPFIQQFGIALACLFTIVLPFGSCTQYGDAEHITAILGESVVLNCPVSQPETPYIIQWKRQHHKIPIYIWYDGYDPHVEDNYKGRASRVNPNANYGLASLNLTSVRENDQGWYECNVFYLDRTGATDNGTWIHLDVHAPPRFVTTPDDVTYVNIGDSIILNCEAEGTPTPEIMWFRDDKPVTPTDNVGIFNDGTELRINKIRDEDIGDYLCVARNAEGRVVHDAKVVIAGGAVIFNGPHNITRLEGEKADFPCEAKALPGNVTVVWKRENVPIDQLSWLDSRSIVRRDGTLVINPTSADDGGFFTCEVSNGIGTPQRATAYLNVEYPARVTYTPTVQYLPFRQQGIIKCHIKSNPPNRFVTWIKDKRLFDPDNEEGVVRLKNGSLLITKVNQNHQGRYSCTPYNKHTTAGSSGDMEVLVREPPVFDPKPQPQYHAGVGEDVTLVCGGKGSPTPSVTWRKRDGQNLPRDRTEIHGGNLTMKSLRKGDHGFYECEVKNEIMTIVTATQLLVEGTTPHPPYNITTETTPFGVELSWLPGYPGGRDYDQKYTIWYRTLGSNTWSQIDVKPAGSTSVSIHNLTPESTYEFQVQGKNDLGDGMFSDIVTATTKAVDGSPPKPKPNKEKEKEPPYPDDEEATPKPPGPAGPKPDSLPLGPQPGPPTDLKVKRVKDGFFISWKAPEESTVMVQYYDIEYKIEGGWKKLNKENIVGETSYKVKKLMSAKTYNFRVLAKTVTSFQKSEEIKYEVPIISKEREITAAIVGGILFFIVAIILSVCTVKICNKRKRKKQDKAYNMVTCRVGDNINGAGGPPVGGGGGVGGVVGGGGGVGPPKSPAPIKNVLRSGISSLREIWRWIGATLLGFSALDATDNHPLHSSSEYERYAYEENMKDASSEIDFMQRAHYDNLQRELRTRPLAPITRTMDGKFVVDKDSSEEGGFTSPRRPIRGLVRKKHSYSPYYFPQMPFIQRFRRVNQSSDDGFHNWQLVPTGVEGGVYHVRAGTTQTLIPQTPIAPPRLSLRSEGSGASAPTSGSRLFPLSSLRTYASPEFGQHFIPDSPGNVATILSQRRVRSSSPTPYTDEWNQLAQLVSFSEVSSVRQPSSVERSFPSTVLSSFQNSAQKTPSMHGTPLNASSLLQESAQSEYNKIIRQQERMLHEHQLIMRRQQERDMQRELSPLRRLPDYDVHGVRADVHSPQYHHHFVHPLARDAGYMSHIPLSWATPRRPPFTIHSHSQFETLPQVRYRGPRSHMFTPPYRDTIGYQPAQDNFQHYVNIPSGRRDYYQRISGLDPYYLLKSPSLEIQKPLATSSPPRPRVHPPLESQKSIVVKPSTKKRVPEFQNKSKEKPKVRPHLHELGDSDSSIDHPAGYTRDHLQQAIGRVRSGILRTSKRPHSAPNLSSSIRTDSPIDNSSTEFDKRLFVKVTKSGVNVPVSHDLSNEKSQEMSQEQSPDSSSGFGSKNTSQQQSSSQSGQSASALGLDSSRFETSEVTEPSLEWEKSILQQPSPPPLPLRPKALLRPSLLQRQPPTYDQWLSRRVLPQFRLPGTGQSAPFRYPALMLGVPRVPSLSPARLPLTPNLSIDFKDDALARTDQHTLYENVVSRRRAVRVDRDITEPLTINTTPRTLNLGQTPLHDISVDDHYEFDTVLSPTPGGEESDIFWSRSRLHSGDRGLSDSEIYGSGGKQKETHESMEARVAAMKQEFQEYRQRQAKRRSSRELESVC